MRALVSTLVFLVACGSDGSGESDADNEGGGAGARRNEATGGRANGGRRDEATGGRSDAATAGRGSSSSSGGSESFGDWHTGNFWRGPVDYEETEWHNACAPSVKYPAGIRALYGDYIMGLANEVTLEGLVAGKGQLCDVCVELEANGKSLIARVVTFGVQTGPNDIDVSPEIDAALDAERGRTARWRFVTCPTSDPIHYTFDGRQWENTWFFRVWVRNARVPIRKLEYRVGSGGWEVADWQGDGAWQASSRDFSGGFSLRVTAIDGRTITDEIPGLNTFDPDVGIRSSGNF